MRSLPLGNRRARAGVTVIELLIAGAVLVIVLASIGGVLVSSLRAQRAAEEQSLRIQESEAIVHLINYEVGLAGYRGTVNERTFSSGADDTITVTLPSGGGSGAIRVRFFEDPDFLAASDTGERLVQYRVQGGALERIVMTGGGSVVDTEVLVGGVTALQVVEFVDRQRTTYTPQQVAAGLPENTEIAGVRFTVQFADQSEWTFLVGLYNQQVVRVVGA